MAKEVTYRSESDENQHREVIKAENRRNENRSIGENQ